MPKKVFGSKSPKPMVSGPISQLAKPPKTVRAKKLQTPKPFSQKSVVKKPKEIKKQKESIKQYILTKNKQEGKIR